MKQFGKLKSEAIRKANFAGTKFDPIVETVKEKLRQRDSSNIGANALNQTMAAGLCDAINLGNEELQKHDRQPQLSGSSESGSFVFSSFEKGNHSKLSKRNFRKESCYVRWSNRWNGRTLAGSPERSPAAALEYPTSSMYRWVSGFTSKANHRNEALTSSEPFTGYSTFFGQYKCRPSSGAHLAFTQIN